MRLIQQALNMLKLYSIDTYESEDGLQITATLAYDEKIHIMKSNKGWHVGYGKISSLDASPPMSEEEAARKIYGA